MLETTIEEANKLIKQRNRYLSIKNGILAHPRMFGIHYKDEGRHSNTHIIYLDPELNSYDDISEADIENLKDMFMLRVQKIIDKFEKDIAGLQDPPAQMVGLNAKPPAS